MHNDGMVYFPIDGSDRGLLVQNHEYTDDVLLFTDGTANWDAEKTAKSLNAHGVGIVEVAQGRRHVDGRAALRVRAAHHRPDRCDVAGPAAGHRLLRTSADPTGRKVLGTLNNCAMGFTPWGTYLACEENFNGYFRKAAGVPQTGLERRYGIDADGFGYLWHLTDTRFRVDDDVVPGEPGEPNEPNRFGWVTEIDPFDPELDAGQAHGARSHEARRRLGAGSAATAAWSSTGRRPAERVHLPLRLALAVARSPSSAACTRWTRARSTSRASRRDGYGDWLPLTPRNPKLAGWSLADIMINTRGAADLVGATKMDRPEWIDTFPNSLTAIATLTNNSRAAARTRAAPAGRCGEPAADQSLRPHHPLALPARLDREHVRLGDLRARRRPGGPGPRRDDHGDKYGSPDGIYVDPRGRIWIQTDVSASTVNTGAYAGFGNNQMLAADPVTRETRRFLVGPNGLRGHRRVRHAGREDDVRRHPAPGRSAGRATTRPPTRSATAAGPTAPPVGARARRRS